MKSTWFGAILFAAAVSFTLGCVKDEDEKVEPVVETPDTSIGGKGGNATLEVIPTHNGIDIDSCYIYIAYNTLDTTRNFDDSMLCKPINGRPRAIFTGLKKGNYFVAGKGWDLVKSQKVSGVVAFTIPNNEIYHTLELPIAQ